MEISKMVMTQQPTTQRIAFQERNPVLSDRAELMVREIEEKYRSFFENIEQGYYETDISGNITFFNEFICKMLGYSKKELIGKNFNQFIDNEDSRRVRQAFRNIYEMEKPEIGLVFRIIRKDGIKRMVGTSTCLIKDIGGRRIGFRGIARDISERKTMEYQDKQTQKLESIGQLAAGIAHEINTPIQYLGDNIRFFQDSFQDIEMILERFRKLLEAVKTGSVAGPFIHEVESAMEEIDLEYLEEELPKAIEQSLEGLHHVTEIVSAMKQFCHPGIEEKKATDINKAIQNTITVTRNEWKYVADMVTDFDPAMPPVLCLQGEFKQVIMNLIINAAHSIEDVVGKNPGEKGIIKIRTHYDDTWAEVRVSDTGQGIPKDIRPRIFDPFFTTKDVGKGSGQGLAISHSVIVNKHYGTIGFETEMGKGTTMIIRLPMDAKHEG